MAYGVSSPPSYLKPDSLPFLEWFRSITSFVNSLVNTKTVTTTYTVDIDTTENRFKTSIAYVRANATGGGFTITLPKAEFNLGRKILIKKIDSSANVVTIAATGSDTIEGSASKTLSAQWNSYYLIAGASGSWEII